MEDDDRKTLVERVVDATNEKVTRVQNEVNPVVSATRDRANCGAHQGPAGRRRAAPGHP